MTQEQKAKAYDEALERMKSWVRGEHPECFTEAQKAAEFIFPELKESDDEKIIREITAFFRKAAGGYLDTSTPCKTYSKWLAWLEKQGDKYSIWVGGGEVNDYYLSKDEAEKLAYKYRKEGYDDVVIAKLGEQKPSANKVELKFKVGDWVVITTSDGEKIVQIDSIEYFKSGEPRYITSEGRWFGNGTEAHLWTIQDAKDGDVLATKKVNPFIYDKNRYNNGLAYYYAGIDVNKELTLKSPHTMLDHFGELSNVFPATKEQRDRLFKKMHEAGYEFNFITKELKKINK